MESDVREKILGTARCIFLKEDYKGTTINSIARAARIPPSTIHLHLDGKKDLSESLDISEEEASWDAYDADRTPILQTALILLRKHGYDGVSMDMLARRSGYSKVALYRYFKDKEGLYSAATRRTPLYLNFLSVQPEMDNYDLEAAIKKIGLAYLAVFDTSERVAFIRAIVQDSKRHPEVSSIYHRNGISYVVRCIETVPKKYVGNLQEGVDLYLAAKIYMGSLLGFVIQHKIVARVEPQYEGDEIVNTLTKIFLHGILH